MKPTRRGSVRLALGLGAILWACALALTSAEQAISVELKDQHRSGVSANAKLISQGNETVVVVTLERGPNGSFLPDIRSGTCSQAAAQPEIPLAIATHQSSSTTTIDVALSNLINGSYVVMLHRADGDITSLAPEKAVACGAITVPAKAKIVTSAPFTGIGPSDPHASSRSIALALAGLAGGLTLVAWWAPKIARPR